MTDAEPTEPEAEREAVRRQCRPSLRLLIDLLDPAPGQPVMVTEEGRQLITDHIEAMCVAEAMAPFDAEAAVFAADRPPVVDGGAG